MDGSGGFTEKRLQPRRRALKGGRIVFNRASSTINCTLRNYSENGAKLEVASALGIPDVIDLKLDGQPVRPVSIVWRAADALGVEFIAF